MSKPRVLILTRLFPSKDFPCNGTFCAERVKALSRHADVRVAVPTPYLPQWLPLGHSWQKWARVERERRTLEKVLVTYPRFLMLPRAGTWLQGVTIAKSVKKEMLIRHRGWLPDLVDGHFAFPDGYAAVKLAQYLECRSFVTCHGSDLVLYPPLLFINSMLRWTFRNADRVISVSKALQRRSIELGCPQGKNVFLSNGVDPELFKLREKEECRSRLGLPLAKFVLVCVGSLNENKNQLVLIRALARIRDLGANPPLLVLVGDGPRRIRLELEVQRFGIDDSVRLTGERPYNEIPYWMGAADCVVLSSFREGWPTVYFEAMACGRPVITSDVDSAKDAICKRDYGIVVGSNTAEGFAEAMIDAGTRKFDAPFIREYAKHHSWDEWAQVYLKMLEEVRLEKGHKRK